MRPTHYLQSGFIIISILTAFSVSCGLTTSTDNNARKAIEPNTPDAPNPDLPPTPSIQHPATDSLVEESNDIHTAITVPVRFVPKPFADSAGVTFKCLSECDGNKTIDATSGAFEWKTDSAQAIGEYNIVLGAFRGEKQIGKYSIKATLAKWEPAKRFDLKGSHPSAQLGYSSWLGDMNADKKDEFIVYEMGDTIGTTTYPHEFKVYTLKGNDLEVVKTAQSSNRYGAPQLLYNNASGVVVLGTSRRAKTVKGINVNTGVEIFSITNAAAGFAFDSCVLGDINGDAVADFAVSTSGKVYDAAVTSELVAIYDGNSRNILHTFTGTANEAGFGAKLACGADFNGDGKNDIAIGADWANAGGTERGSVLVYDLQSKALLHRLDGSENGEHLGRDLSFIKDLDGDKKAELMVGSPFASGGGTKRGKVTFISSKLSILKSINGEEDNSEFNKAISLGDINDDGVDDFLICAETANQGGTWKGKIFIYNGADQGLLYSLAGDTDNGQFGERMTFTTGDLNGDGKKDILVGNALHSENATTLNIIGRANVFLSP